MHGLGNDYVYIDCFQAETSLMLGKIELPTLARSMSDRHLGIGSDGLVLIVPSMEANARMRMFNADGSEAQMCGNAIRCVGKYLYESGLCRKPEMTIETLSGNKKLALQVKDGVVEQVTVEMGQAQVRHDELGLDAHSLEFMRVNMGNPHAVFFCDQMPDTDEIAIMGKRIEKHPHFAEGTNVEFVCVENRREMEMRVWERGTGETMACGTGACASAVAAVEQGKTEREVTIHLLGGDLFIRIDEQKNVYLTGTATEVFRGTYNWEK
ncbi:MAG: diaminopimelate epimerase [Paludibacteraceae bacterium]|nr:diaminopimelate epimerase [Paludibacteraceae bacterium]